MSRSLLFIVVFGVGLAGAAELVPGDRPLAGGLLGPHEPAAVAAEVRARGFYGGKPLGAGMCARCHPDVAGQWAQSAHRFASFNNPYYAAAANAFRRDRGDGEFRFCANCHDPLLTPRETPVPTTPDDPMAQAGITCLVCHSVSDPPELTGNGDFRAHLQRFPLGEGHGARLKPATLITARFCGTCHKVGLSETVTGDRWFRGQDEYDGWRDSAWSGRGTGTVQRPTETRTCHDCHMPRVSAPLGDKGAKSGRVRDHRFLGANTALAHLRGDADLVAATDAFLRRAVTLHLAQTRPGVVDVVMVNRRVGHPFPGGVNDANEAWLTWTISDDDGGVLDAGGQLDAEGRLAPDAYRIRAQPVTASGHPLPRRAVQDHRGVAYDTRLPPRAPRAVRLALPPKAKRVSVVLRYRQHDPAFAQFACEGLPSGPDKARCLAAPVTEMASVATRLDAMGRLPPPDAWRRRLEHGLALTAGLAHHAREAMAVFTALQAAKPAAVEPILGAAMAAAKLGQTDEVVALGKQIDALGVNPRARHFIEAKALARAFRHGPARTAAEALLALTPDDRDTLALVARLRGLDGDPEGALTAAQALTTVEPEDPRGWLQLSLAQRDLGHPSDLARARWLRHRVDGARNLQLRGQLRAHLPRLVARTEPMPTLNAAAAAGWARRPPSDLDGQGD